MMNLTSNFEIYVCPVCGDTEKKDYPTIYLEVFTHRHIDEIGQEYMVQLEKVYPKESDER